MAYGGHMKRMILAASAAGLTVALGGCATITRGTTTQFTVESTPPGAQARTSTGFTCEATPCTFKMPRKEGFVITVSKAGYKPSETSVKSVMASTGAAGFLGNAVVGGVIGAGVDISSGAMLDLSPSSVRVTLEPQPPAAAPSQAADNTPAQTASNQLASSNVSASVTGASK